MRRARPCASGTLAHDATHAAPWRHSINASIGSSVQTQLTGVSRRRRGEEQSVRGARGRDEFPDRMPGAGFRAGTDRG